MKTSTTLRITVSALAAVGLAACGSSTSGEDAATPASSPADVASATAPPETQAPADTASVAAAPKPSTCPEFRMTAAHMATDWQYLTINIGTTNDEGPTLLDLKSGSAALQELAPTCAPEAVESIDAFAATVEAIQPIYTTQPTGTQVQEVDDALAAMQEAGAQMYADLGQSDYAWQ